MKTTVSIIILTQNAMGTVDRLLDRLLPQLSVGQHELLFLDSSSTDGTTGYIQSVPYQNKRLLNVADGTFSHSRTRMWGAENCQSDLVVFFTDDIVPCNKDFLEQLIAPVANGSVVATFGNSQIDPTNGDPLRAHRYNSWHEKRPDALGPYSLGEWDAMPPDQRFNVSRFDDCAACYDRKTLLNIRFPDVPYGEDIAIAKRLLLSGHRIGLSKKALFYHWHNVTFNYFIKRMCIEQYVIKDLFKLVFFKNIFHVLFFISLQIILYLYLALTVRNVPTRMRPYWFAYSLKYIAADNFGKYIGSLDGNCHRWQFIRQYLLKWQSKWVEAVTNNSIKRNSVRIKL